MDAGNLDTSVKYRLNQTNNTKQQLLFTRRKNGFHLCRRSMKEHFMVMQFA